jgi:hypothetical protein
LRSETKRYQTKKVTAEISKSFLLLFYKKEEEGDKRFSEGDKRCIPEDASTADKLSSEGMTVSSQRSLI